MLTGRVQHRQERLLIKVELVDVADGSQVWGEQYNQKFEDILTIETKIAGEIVEKLRLKLSSGMKKRLSRHSTENTEAYQLFLKGRFYFYKQTEKGMLKAIEYFEQAIDKEPRYALAYAWLAHTYSSLLYWGYLSRDEALPKVSAALEKALELDGMLAEAHLVLAETKFHYDWDWSAAEREFKRAIELKPNFALAHLLYAFYLADMGRFDEAFAEAKRAQELDPLSLIANMGVGFIFAMARRSDAALDQGRRLLEMEPYFFGAHWLIGTAYYLKGMYEQSIAEHKKALDFGGSPVILASLGRLYGLSGRRSEALHVIEELSEMRKQRYIPAINIAGVYAGLGEPDQAFEWLERAYQERNSALTSLGVNSALDNLRSDSRFDDLLERVGLAHTRQK